MIFDERLTNGECRAQASQSKPGQPSTELYAGNEALIPQGYAIHIAAYGVGQAIWRCLMNESSEAAKRYFAEQKRQQERRQDQREAKEYARQQKQMHQETLRQNERLAGRGSPEGREYAAPRRRRRSGWFWLLLIVVIAMWFVISLPEATVHRFIGPILAGSTKAKDAVTTKTETADQTPTAKADQQGAAPAPKPAKVKHYPKCSATVTDNCAE